MSKTFEEILKEFAEKITDYGYYNNECGYYVDWKDGVMPIVEKYANIIIAQTREETIMEVESKISKIPKIEMTFSDIKDVLNKLKK